MYKRRVCKQTTIRQFHLRKCKEGHNHSSNFLLKKKLSAQVNRLISRLISLFITIFSAPEAMNSPVYRKAGGWSPPRSYTIFKKIRYHRLYSCLNLLQILSLVGCHRQTGLSHYSPPPHYNMITMMGGYWSFDH